MGLTLNGTHQFLFCADDINLLDGNINVIQQYMNCIGQTQEGWTSSEFWVRLVVNGAQGAGQTDNTKIHKKSF